MPCNGITVYKEGIESARSESKEEIVLELKIRENLNYTVRPMSRMRLTSLQKCNRAQ